MNIYKDWKAKLESAYSFMLKYSKITVCYFILAYYIIYVVSNHIISYKIASIHIIYIRTENGVRIHTNDPNVSKLLSPES